MTVKLKILHGKLQSKHGGSMGLEVDIRGSRFVIGSAADCSMRCPSTAVSPRHCELTLVPGGAFIRDLGSETGVFVNDQRIEGDHLLSAGDHLRIGRLEFEVLIEEAAPAGPADGEEGAVTEQDPVSEDLTTSLMDADERDRKHRLLDPELRQFHLEQAAAEARKIKEQQQAEAERKDAAETSGGKKKRKPRRAKFIPPPPPPPSENTEDAAQEALRKLFGR
jgi:pSer/pThr/pTyr-binding forkhead associated (FHA) protein